MTFVLVTFHSASSFQESFLFDVASLVRELFVIDKVYSLFVFLLEWRDYYFDHFYSHTSSSVFIGRSVLEIFS